MKPERMIPEAEARQILKDCSLGTLSLVTPEGLPYGVPVNYLYDEDANALYFHCALEGKKMDCLLANPRVSFSVYKNPVIVQERFTTHYDSALVTGTAQVISDPGEKRAALIAFSMALAPKGAYRLTEVADRSLHAVAMVKIRIEKAEGKRNRDV